ncbi:hypothetical protein [Magnetospirillum molischianum]|uniref:Uncharacterized protein n=1 Tax=Magnetospirillum molischianum DSM 120 TaxID=1150626 RepID=H8FYE1_MAGML|nr:hypothetical protein [Magnetospirillum molischianum]CCG43379.1 conserved hypothetical protein [Magnetospirillum molischianum DSM 120]
MTIPEIRERLRELADVHGISELSEIADKLKRRYNGRKAPRASKAVTPALAAEVRDHCKAHPEETMHQVATKFGINQGRVSEILFGKRS